MGTAFIVIGVVVIIGLYVFLKLYADGMSR